MSSMEVKRVPFMGTELMAAKDETGQVWAGIRWMCDGIGLSRNQTDNQVQKIRSDSVLSTFAGNFPLNQSGHGSRDMLCLKIEAIPLWLAKISVTPKMREETPEVADRLIQFQLKAKDALAAAFLPDTLRFTPTGTNVAVSPGGLARLLTVYEHMMKDAGKSHIEIMAVTKSVSESFGVFLPVAFTNQIPGQLCLFDDLLGIEDRKTTVYSGCYQV